MQQARPAQPFDGAKPLQDEEMRSDDMKTLPDKTKRASDDVMRLSDKAKWNRNDEKRLSHYEECSFTGKEIPANENERSNRLMRLPWVDVPFSSPDPGLCTMGVLRLFYRMLMLPPEGMQVCRK